jgi:hypothetical protein
MAPVVCVGAPFGSLARPATDSGRLPEIGMPEDNSQPRTFVIRRKRTPTSVIAVLALFVALGGTALAPGVAQASPHRRHCGSIKVDASPFQVFVESGSVSCAGARAVMFALYHGHHSERCYRDVASECHNGRPTDGANTVILVGSWQCGTGAGGGSCTRGRERISATYIESSAEKTAQAKREDAENKTTVTECENNPGDALIQEGSAPRYIYECLTWGKLGNECAKYPAICREAMYSESQATTKWEERVAQACHAVGAIASQHTRKQNGALEYECIAQEASTIVAWVSLPYMPPEEYAEWTGPGQG